MGDRKKVFIPKEIKELRNSLGLTQFELAAKIRVTPQLVAGWEQKRKTVGPGSLIKLGLLAPAPLCWEFFAAAGLEKAIIESKVAEGLVKTPAQRKKIRALSDELHRKRQAEKAEKEG